MPRLNILIEEWKEAGFSVAIIALAAETPLVKELGSVEVVE